MKDLFPKSLGQKRWVCIIHGSTLYTAKYSKQAIHRKFWKNKYKKRYTNSLVFREIQTKTRFCIIVIRMQKSEKL